MTRERRGTSIDGKELRPESSMMSYGYRPELSEGAIKCPIFQTSTFVFESAEAGKSFFEVAYGLREKGPSEELGLIYSRLNNPDLEILENRLTLWDGAEEAAVFESGMAAISTSLLALLRPGDLILYSEPLYGGTDYLFRHVLPEWDIRVLGFPASSDGAEVRRILDSHADAARLAMVFVETPANPTNELSSESVVAETPDAASVTGVEENANLADLLEETARLLDAQDANPFRVNAYRLAADVLRVVRGREPEGALHHGSGWKPGKMRRFAERFASNRERSTTK